MRGQKKEKAGDIKDAAVQRRPGYRRVLLCLILAAVALFFFGRWLTSEELEVTFQHLYSSKIAGGENIRVVVLSDLHNREFGTDNEDLAEQITALRPDIIAIAGDMVNADDDNLDIILSLCRKLVEIAPVYYSPGNHESNLMYEKGSPIESLLIEEGVHVLVNRAEEVTVNRTPLLIGGMPTSVEGYEIYGAEFFEEYEKSTAFKLLIAHYPSLYYEAIADGAVDLGICGHYHGGQFRLPVVGGLYHGDTGLFPRYNGGMYHLQNGTIFVSRGMGGHNGLPRINNRPELAVIDINGRQEAGSQ
ncbi:MAG: metallophosphoesterase [Lachnospiraceae bacterium]|nr:metallophosphoesterase [Lachnospiraceae bacterium]